MNMLFLNESTLREFVRREYINILREQSYDRDIVGLILILKDELKKRNIVSNTQFSKPCPDKRNSDYGYCNIRIDTTIGRGSKVSPRALNRLIGRLCNKVGLNKYFIPSDYGHDGKYCDCGLKLKPRYVQKYLQQI